MAFILSALYIPTLIIFKYLAKEFKLVATRILIKFDNIFRIYLEKINY